MKEVALQIQHKCPHCKSVIRPFSQQDDDLLREYKLNQPIRAKTYGIQKERSVIQLALYWALCGVLAENTDDANWNHENKVDEQIKIKCRYIKSYIVVEGVPHIITGSIAFKNLTHIAACNYFDRAFVEMAKFIGVPVEKLLKEGKKGLTNLLPGKQER